MQTEDRDRDRERTVPEGIPRDLGIEQTVEALAEDGGLVYLFYPAERVLWLPDRTAERFHCRNYYEDYPESVADAFVTPDNREQFITMHRAVQDGYENVSEMFFSPSFLRKFRITMRVVKKNPDGTPQIALGQFLTNVREERLGTPSAAVTTNLEMEPQAVSMIADGISSLYYAIYYISMKDEAFVCYHEKMNGILDLIGMQGNFRPAWKDYIDSSIYEEDREKMRMFANFDTLGERLMETNRISVVYRRIGIGWTRGSFVVAKRDSAQKPEIVLYVVSDINEEIDQQTKLEEAEYEAAHDALTAAWNRQTYENLLQWPERYAKKIGFLLLDVDRFKDINDLYGHEAGDAVLCRVSELLRSLFRRQDLVIRMGGDEFAVVLQDYRDNIHAWDSICRKIEALHIGLQDVLSESMVLTLSSGFSFSEDGFSRDLYTLADQGVYYSKTTGRAGCAMLSADGSVEREWKDFLRTESENTLMERHRFRPWKMVFRTDGSRELYSAKMAIEISQYYPDCTPADVFRGWYDCLTDKGKQESHDFVRAMRNGEVVEITLFGKHPTRGMLPFRICGSKVSDDGEGEEVFSGYYHLLEEIHVLSDHVDLTGIRQALEEEYFCNYYIDLQNDSFYAYKEQGDMHDRFRTWGEAQKSLREYAMLMVEEESLQEALHFFDLHTLPERMQSENLLTMDFKEKGSRGWLRAKLVVARRDEQGIPINVCFLASSIQKEKRLEEERALRVKRRAERQRKLLDLFGMLNIPAVMFVKIRERSYNLVMNQWDRSYMSVGDYDEMMAEEVLHVVPEDQEKYMRCISLEHMQEELDENGRCEFDVRQYDEEGKVHRIFYHSLYLDESQEQFMLVGEVVPEELE